MRRDGVGKSAAILYAGLPKWLAEGRPTESGMPTPPPCNAVAKRAAGQVRTKEDLLANVESQAEQVLDARGAPRFTGEEKEPRPGMASGQDRKSTRLNSSH